MDSTHSSKAEVAKVAPAEQQHLSPIKALWRIVTHVDQSKINVWQALRNTIGVVLPLIVGFALGMPRGGLAVAGGAFNVSYSDGRDPYARRGESIMASTASWPDGVLLG